MHSPAPQPSELAEVARLYPDTDQPIPALWTVTEVAEFLGVHQKTVEKMASRGEFPGHMVRSRRRFYPPEILAWLLEQPGG